MFSSLKNKEYYNNPTLVLYDDVVILNKCFLFED